MGNNGILSLAYVALGAALGFVASWLTTRQAYEQQLQRDRISHEWALQETKRDRLRDAFKVILYAARAYQSVAYEQRFLMGETEAQRDERLQRILTTAVEPTAAALVAISLEDVDKDIEGQCLKLQTDYRQYRGDLQENKRFPGMFPNADEQLSEIDKQVTQLVIAMQTRLAQRDSAEKRLPALGTDSSAREG